MGGEWVHRLIEKDAEARSGVCETCGPVRLYVRANGLLQCATQRSKEKADYRQRLRARVASDPDLAAHLAALKRARVRDPVKAAEARRRYRSRVKYGTSVDALEEMRRQQDGRCAICRQDVDLVIDHCHETGKVRGLLCSRCNWGIGWLGDQLPGVEAAAAYLRRAASGDPSP